MLTASQPLPGKPSALIRVALRDLEACEKGSRYEIDMDAWHLQDSSGFFCDTRCHVCLAGAVMSQTLQVAMNQHLYPSEFDEDTADKLIALDSFRVGDVTTGLDRMSGLPDDNIQQFLEDNL